MLTPISALVHPTIAIKYKKSLLSNLGSTALVQMIILMFCSISMLAVSIFLAYGFGSAASYFRTYCGTPDMDDWDDGCSSSDEAAYLKAHYGTFGGFNSSAALPMGDLRNEAGAFFIANGAQVLYSGIYLLLTYNLTLISMELDWGGFETIRKRLRCTLVRGSGFSQSYCLQLRKKILIPMMAFSATMHWLLGQAISARETVYSGFDIHNQPTQVSLYSVSQFSYIVKSSLTLQGGLRYLFHMVLNNTHDDHDWSLLVGFHLYTRRIYATDVWLDTHVLCCHYRTRGLS